MGGKAVLVRRKRLMSMVSDSVISTDTGGALVKQTSEANALDKCRAVS